MKTFNSKPVLAVIAGALIMLFSFGGCASDQATAPEPEAAKPVITFDLPERWRPAQQSAGGSLYWSTYIPSEIVYMTPPKFERDEREEQHYWKFTMEAFDVKDGFGDYSAKDARGAAQEYRDMMAVGCTPEDKCSVEAVTEEEYSGVTVYTVRMRDWSGHPLDDGEYARFFFVKDGYFIEFGYRGVIEDPVGLQTVEKVLSTINIAGNGTTLE